jgi:hypothetical protein
MQSFIYKCGELQAAGNSICLCLTPQKAPLDSMHTVSWFVSYRRLSPQFQFSLSAAALGIYQYGSTPPFRIELLVSLNSTHQTRVISLQNKWKNRSRGTLELIVYPHRLCSAQNSTTFWVEIQTRDLPYSRQVATPHPTYVKTSHSNFLRNTRQWLRYSFSIFALRFLYSFSPNNWVLLHFPSRVSF